MKRSLLLLFLTFFSRVYAQEVTTEDPDETTVITTTSLPILYLSDRTPSLSWSPRSTDSIVIQADEGYQISVNITDCNIDGENGEYATISTNQSTTGLLFSYTVSRQPAYLYNTSILFGEFVGTNASNFTAVFTRIGEPLTTTVTDIPTTTIILPTPAYNDSDTLDVYLAGRASTEYVDEVIDSLVNAITRMAVEYCDNENFPINGTITSENVQIRRLAPCSLSWPNSETCVILTFAVPVQLVDDSNSIWGGYQMTTQHLQIMWNRYLSYLPEGETIYAQPDMDQLKWGIVISAGIIAIFVIIIFVIRHYGIKVSKIGRRRPSDAASIISESDRNSQISLPPHYLQETPPLFENAYPMYNPEKSSTYAEPTYTKPFDYADSDYQDINTKIKDQPNDDDIEESGA